MREFQSKAGAFDLKQEAGQLREITVATAAGQRMILERRLVEGGGSFFADLTFFFFLPWDHPRQLRAGNQQKQNGRSIKAVRTN